MTIRTTLAAAEAGCDDLAVCASHPRCPLPFAPLAGNGEGPAEDNGRRRTLAAEGG